MLKKFISFTFFAFLVQLASALQLSVSQVTPITSGGQVTISWTSNPATDPSTFDIELANSAYRNTYAVKASVITALNSIVVNLPTVLPGAGYSIQATAVGNVNNVLSSVGPFTIAGPTSATGSTTLSPISGSTLSMPLTLLSSSTPASVAPTATAPAFNGASNVKPIGVVGAIALVAAGGALAGF